ncbi:MAG: alpha/beta hydrolase [Bacteroidetes bacterium]|nr:alpha/beta hydrolase [Bacteroidota bacterium]
MNETSLQHSLPIFLWIIFMFAFQKGQTYHEENIHPMKNDSSQMTVYLIPGHGSDYRVFNHLSFPDHYTIRHVHFQIPEKGASMEEYALELAKQIDTSEAFILVGVSLGGMLVTEMNEFLSPQKTFIIASAKCRQELPLRYRFQKYVPIQKLVPPSWIKQGALVLQPIVEPDRKEHADTYISMLKDKDPDLMARGVAMILNWERENYHQNIIHIHGTKDHTLPIRNIDYNYRIKGGSHMITLNRGEEITKIIQRELNLL